MPTLPSSEPVWLMTPGVRVTSWVKLRPFNMSWSICLPVTVAVRADDWVSTWATLSPVTSTTSVTAPTVSCMSTRIFWATSSTTPVAEYFSKGFQKYSATGVVLDVAQKIRVDIQLTVGAVTEVVEVTGESVAQVETQSSALTATVTGKQIDQLMLNGRNFTQLVTLTPGVISQTGSDEGKVGIYGNVSYSMNGGPTEYNNWELDGGDNMDNGSNASLNVYPHPEAIAEFKGL